MSTWCASAVFAVHDSASKRDAAKEFGASPWCKDSIKASGQENWRSETCEDHKNQAGVTWFAISVEEGPWTSCVMQWFLIVFLLFLFPVFGRTDLESDNCIKFRHAQTTSLLKIRFICVEFFLKVEVNQIGSIFHSREPNWVQHWYLLQRWRTSLEIFWKYSKVRPVA